MADRMKDEEDRLLESLFRMETIPDDGFSQRVTRRLRQRQWPRRVALLLAVVLGAAIAYEPATQLLQVFSSLSALLPEQLLRSATDWLPAMQTLLAGGLCTVAAIVGYTLLEE